MEEAGVFGFLCVDRGQGHLAAATEKFPEPTESESNTRAAPVFLALWKTPDLPVRLVLNRVKETQLESQLEGVEEGRIHIVHGAVVLLHALEQSVVIDGARIDVRVAVPNSHTRRLRLGGHILVLLINLPQ